MLSGCGPFLQIFSTWLVRRRPVTNKQVICIHTLVIVGHELHDPLGSLNLLDNPYLARISSHS